MPPATPLVGEIEIAVFEGVGIKRKPPPAQPVFSRTVSTKTKAPERLFAVFEDRDIAPVTGFENGIVPAVSVEDVVTTSATETQIEIEIGIERTRKLNFETSKTQL